MSGARLANSAFKKYPKILGLEASKSLNTLKFLASADLVHCQTLVLIGALKNTFK